MVVICQRFQNERQHQIILVCAQTLQTMTAAREKKTLPFHIVRFLLQFLDFNYIFAANACWGCPKEVETEIFHDAQCG